MKRLFLIPLALVLVLGLILVGCSTSTPAPTSTSAPPSTTTSAPPSTTTSAPPSTTTSAPPSATTSAPPSTTVSPTVQPITLKFNGAQFSATDVPGQSYTWFCNTVTEKTKGAIKFQYVGSNSLTKPTEEITALQSGLVDVGGFSLVYYAAPFYVNAGFPRTVPFDITDVPTATKAAYDLYYTNPATVQILTNEFSRQNLKFLYMTIDDSYVIESRDPIAALADLKGKKIAVLGSEAKFFGPTGAVVQGMPAGDRGTALQTKVIDAGAAPFEISFAARTYEFAPNMIQSGFGCVTGNAVAWNLSKFNALPKATQDILIQAGKDAFMQNAKITSDWYITALDTRAKSTGNKPYLNFSDADLTAWAGLVGEPVADWIKAAPASSGADVVVKAWIEAEKATGYKFPKEWKTQ
jgi:TRAP-type C4-dicarboxylate transport system substrate-binding protein